MPQTLDLPVIENRTAFNLKRWRELSADPEIAALGYRVSTDPYGNLLLMPIPGFGHAGFQFEVGKMMDGLMTGGMTLGECSISTSGGIRGPDAAWISHSRAKKAVKDGLLLIAPEICVEVLSASNTKAEIEEKMALYFEAGAKEVWLCDAKGRMFFYHSGSVKKPAVKSPLCPEFPSRLK